MKEKLFLLLALLFSGVSRAGERVVVPAPITGVGYAAHTHLTWSGSNGFVYDIYRQNDDDGRFVYCGSSDSDSFMDFGISKSEKPRTFRYRICPAGMSVEADGAGDFEVTVSVPAANQESLLDMVQRYTTRYFSDFMHPLTGMARERSNDTHGDIVTTGGTGFGIMALVAGAERGYLTRQEAAGIICRIISFLERAERFHGAWAHWYDGDTGEPFGFSRYDDGGDLVETAFLVQGLLTARQWLQDGNGSEQELAARIDDLWRGVEWSWYTQGTDSLYWHWSKNYGWKMNHRIKGFDETLITYVLAASSPTYPIDASVYNTCYTTSDYYLNGKSYYGLPLSIGMDFGGPLFFTHYSFLGLDPRGLRDSVTDYFERNRNHSLIHYRYALDNPEGHAGLGSDLWGFTSSDDPLVGYSSHHPGTESQNGTVSPTAAVSSIVYTPQQSMAAIEHMYYDLGYKLFGPYGFYDAYNPSMCDGQSVVRSYLAIDQGPQAVMIENYRSGLLWRLFMSSPEVAAGLSKLGFVIENTNLNKNY